MGGMPMWIWFIIIIAGGVLLFIVLDFLFLHIVLGKAKYSSHPRQMNQGEFKKYYSENQSQKKWYAEYKADQAKIPDLLKKQLPPLIEDVVKLSRQNKETIVETLAWQPTFNPNEYWALAQYQCLLQAADEKLKTLSEEHERLKEKCANLIEVIEEKGLDATIYKKMLQEANVNGLHILGDILENLKGRYIEQKPDENLLRELAAYKEQIKNIPDLRYTLVPSRLVGFAEEMLSGNIPAEELAPREKTVQKVIDIVREYLKG